MSAETQSMNSLFSDTTQKVANTLQNLEPKFYYIFTLIIVAFILFALFSWIYSILVLKTRACNKLNALYPQIGANYNVSFMSSKTAVKGEAIPDFDNNLASIFRNYYVKSSYNSCCGDGYKNNFVNLCALEKCIISGARFLDFEIYSYNNTPIIAASTANNNNIKEMYNFLTVDEVFETLNYMSFDLATTSCAHDPMIIHLRFMSENPKIFDKVADLIEKKLNLNPQEVDSYLFETSKEETLLITPIKNLSKKFIIIANANPSNNIFNNTKLDKFINLKSGGSNCNLYRYNELLNMGNNDPILIDSTKRLYVIVLPNLSNNLYNYDLELPWTNGCQAICMKFQNMDTNLNSYNERFRDPESNPAAFSFILKKPTLRQDLQPPYVIEPSVQMRAQIENEVESIFSGITSTSAPAVNQCDYDSIIKCIAKGSEYGVSGDCIRSAADNDICHFYNYNDEPFTFNDCSDGNPGHFIKCISNNDTGFFDSVSGPDSNWCATNQITYPDDEIFTNISNGMCLLDVSYVQFSDANSHFLTDVEDIYPNNPSLTGFGSVSVNNIAQGLINILNIFTNNPP
jgi:hypothetical protein